MNSQNMNPIGGSNLSRGGASRFQPSHNTVQTKMAMKNRIDPTALVIAIATLSNCDRRAPSQRLLSRGAARLDRNASMDDGGSVGGFMWA
jgi:hypothetical protein